MKKIDFSKFKNPCNPLNLFIVLLKLIVEVLIVRDICEFRSRVFLFHKVHKKVGTEICNKNDKFREFTLKSLISPVD